MKFANKLKLTRLVVTITIDYGFLIVLIFIIVLIYKYNRVLSTRRVNFIFNEIRQQTESETHSFGGRH